MSVRAADGHATVGGGDSGPDIDLLADALGHVFAKPQRLVEAVTHPSLQGLERAHRADASAYERLEFLGDRVLGLMIAEWLLERHPSEREGALAKRHAALVRRDSLAAVAEAVDLGRHLRLSPGEASGGGRSNRSILADACEAVIGALYLDGGLAAARPFIRARWAAMIEQSQAPPMDPKTTLQEWAQARGLALPRYQLVEQSGPDHEPVFRVEVAVEGVAPADGTGPSKRAAEKGAASRMLDQLGVTSYE